jgi:hypothetical protein
VIAPILDRPDLAPIITGLVGKLTVGTETVGFLPGNVSLHEWQTYIWAAWEHVFPDGFYIAEFAVDTSMLFITYLPPLQPQQFYQNTFTPVTFANLQGTANQTGVFANEVGSLHCDLADNTGNTTLTNADRACFVVDQISSRAAFVQMLNGSANMYLNYQLMPAGNDIGMTPPAAPIPPNQRPIQFISVPKNAALGPSDFPRYTMEGLSNGSEMVDTCCVTGTANNQTTMVLPAIGGASAPVVIPMFLICDGATKDYPPDTDIDADADAD